MGLRRATIAVAVLAVLLLAAAVADAAVRLTPARPATLVSTWIGYSTLEGPHTDRLEAWAVTVAPGGRAGMVRLRVRIDKRTSFSRWVRLPARPGTYTYPAPDVRWDPRQGTLGLDQRTGGHAVIVGDGNGCTPSGYDLVPEGCRPDVLRYYLGGGYGQAGEPSLSRGGYRLAIEARTSCDPRRCSRR